MALTPFTTTAEVRAVIGVTPEELEDSTLNLGIYETNLRMELDQIQDNDGALVTEFEVIVAKAENDRSAQEKKLHAAVMLFCPYPVVLQLETGVPLFAPKAITDGKASITRHAESPFKEQFDRARQYYERFRQNLLKVWAAYNATTSTSVGIPLLAVISSPSTDPVTQQP